MDTCCYFSNLVSIVIKLHFALLQVSQRFKVLLREFRLHSLQKIYCCRCLSNFFLKQRYSLVKCNSILTLHSCCTDFRNEGTCIDDLQIWCDTCQIILLSNLQSASVFLHHHNFWKDVVHKCRKPLVCLSLEFYELDHTTNIIWSWRHVNFLFID